MSARYELKRKANGYTGEPEFRAEDFNLSATRTVTGVLIPNSETEAFLSTLANLQAEVGTYDCQALRTGIGSSTDHYPYLELMLQFDLKKDEFEKFVEEAAK